VERGSERAGQSPDGFRHGDGIRAWVVRQE
jgi:hypothetical protein